MSLFYEILYYLRYLCKEPASDRKHADHKGEPLANVHHTFSEVLEHPGRVHRGGEVRGTVEDRRFIVNPVLDHHRVN